MISHSVNFTILIFALKTILCVIFRLLVTNYTFLMGGEGERNLAKQGWYCCYHGRVPHLLESI